MKTVIFERGSAMPAALAEIVERGSTELVRASARSSADRDTRPEVSEADRVVVWVSSSANPDEAWSDVRGLRAHSDVMVVTEGTRPSGIAADHVFAWPDDKDRLMMAFLTGA